MMIWVSTILLAMVVASECQVTFPTYVDPNKKRCDPNIKRCTCTASNGQTGICYEYRSTEFMNCSFLPSIDKLTPGGDDDKHLRENVCNDTGIAGGRERYFCCPSTSEAPLCHPDFKLKEDQCVYDIANTLNKEDARDVCAEMGSKLLTLGNSFICEAPVLSLSTSAPFPSTTVISEEDNVTGEPTDPALEPQNNQVIWYVAVGVAVLVMIALVLVFVVYLHLHCRHPLLSSSMPEEIGIGAINESYISRTSVHDIEGIQTSTYQNGSFYDKELMHAIMERDVHRATWSLQQGANPNTTCSWKTLTSFPLLCYAVEGEDVDIVKVLLGTETIEINWHGDGQCTPLYLATRKGNKDIAEQLLLRGADPDLASSFYEWTPLMTTVETENCSIAELLIMNGASLDLRSGKYNTTPLYLAVVKDKVEMAELLIKSGASLELTSGPCDYSPLMAAVMESNCNMAELLLLNGAIVVSTSGPNAQTPILAAVIKENYSMLEVLIKNRPSLDLKLVEPDRPPLIYAAKAGNRKICHLLLQYGASPDATDSDGYHSIYIAAQYGHKNVIRLIIDYGGDPKQQRIGYSSIAVDIARDHGHDSLAEWLDSQRKLYRREAKAVGPDETYPNESALLCFLNYIEFPNGYRNGADKDKANIISTFNDLNYSIDYYENLSNSETSSVIEKLREDKRLWFKDSVIIVINSHGNEDSTFRTSDGKIYNINDIKNNFTNIQCPQLKHKPKVLIANCCRGKNK